MEFVQFHPTGMVWPPGVIGPARHRGRARRGRHPAQRRGRALHGALRPEAAWSSRPATSSRARSTRRCTEGRGTPHGGVFLDVSHLPAETVQKRAAEHVRPVHGAGRRRHHARADGGRPDVPLRHGRRSGSTPRRAQSRGRPGSSRPASARAGMNGANRLGGNSLSDLLVFGRRAGRGCGRVRRRGRAAPAIDEAEVERRRGRAGRATSRTAATRTRTRCTPSCRTTMQENVGIFRDEAGLDRGARQAIERAEASALADGARPVGARGLQPRLAPLPSTSATCSSCAEAIARAALDAPREPRRAQPARLPGARPTTGAATTSSSARTADGDARSSTRPVVDRARARARSSRSARRRSGR